MYLSSTTIARYLDEGKIKVLPSFDRANIRPTGLRLHLDGTILVPRPGQTVDLAGGQPPRFDPVAIGPEGYVLKPGGFILGATAEKFQVPRDIICLIEGRSTDARLGIIVHCTASTVDGNYDAPASVTLEMANLGPFDIILRPGIPVAMILFAELTEPVGKGSVTKYGSQQSAAAPKL